MKRKMRNCQICFFILLFFVFFLDGCTRSEKVVTTKVSSSSFLKKENKSLKSNYGNTKELIRQAMLEIDNKISVIEDVNIISENKTQGVYVFSDYQIQSELDISKGIENAELKIVFQKQGKELPPSTHTFPVELQDIEGPNIVLKKESIKIYESDTLDLQTYIDKVEDNVDGIISDIEIKNIVPQKDGKWICGQYEVHFIAKDAHNNISDKVMNISVIRENESSIEPVIADLEKNNMNNLALSLIGKPYVWGGKGPDYFDCSGIIMYIYNYLGVQLSWPQVQYGLGSQVSLDPSTWKIGDVLSYSDNSGEIIHHALYLGNALALHALTSGVCIISIHSQIESGPQNYQKLVRVTRYT